MTLITLTHAVTGKDIAFSDDRISHIIERGVGGSKVYYRDGMGNVNVSEAVDDIIADFPSLASVTLLDGRPAALCSGGIVRIEEFGSGSAIYTTASVAEPLYVEETITDLAAVFSGSGGGAGYLVYSAYILQEGTDAPTVTHVFENTVGTVTWSRVSSGSYLATFSYTGDVFALATINEQVGDVQYLVLRQAENGLVVFARIGSTTTADYWGAYIEIRVYP